VSLSTCDCGGRIPLGPDATNRCVECGKHAMDGADLMRPKMNEMDPAAWARASAAAGAKPVTWGGEEPIKMLQRIVEARDHGTIFYAMTPQRFILEIPVEALANLSQDSHTRMLDMLNAWILRHKPLTVTTPKDKP